MRAETSPSALKDLCARMPWLGILSGSRDPFSNGVSLPDGAKVTPWIESGAAEAMARDGVPIANFFREWAKTDPARAIGQAAAWDDPETPYSMRVTNALAAGLDSPECRERISRALDELSREELEKLTAGFAEYAVMNRKGYEEIADLYPALNRKDGSAE